MCRLTLRPARSVMYANVILLQPEYIKSASFLVPNELKGKKKKTKKKIESFLSNFFTSNRQSRDGVYRIPFFSRFEELVF